MDDKWIKGCFFANVVSIIYEVLSVPVYVKDRETLNGIYFWINGYISPIHWNWSIWLVGSRFSFSKRIN